MKRDPKATPPEDGTGAEGDAPFKVDDRRHWARDEQESEADPEAGAPIATPPAIVEELRRRAEGAERRLLDYIAAHKQAQLEHEQFRERMLRDVDRRVELKFGGLVEELLGLLDDLDLAVAHARGPADADALTQGVRLARDRFLAALVRHGVERIDVDGAEFDPNVADAMRVDPVSEPARDGRVTETLRAGFRLGERILRPARVAVGRLES